MSPIEIMSALYFLLPLGACVVTVAALAFRWACKNKQFDDLATPAWRILFEDAPPPKDPN